MLLAGCLRDLPDIPPPSEGGTVTGRVLVRDRASTELVGLRGASVGITGTAIFAATDERGFFQLPRTPLGSLVITITRPYAPGQSRAGRRLDGVSILSSGQSLDLGDIELYGSGDITGSVRVDTDPAAGPGALVVAAQTGYKSVVGLDRAFTLPSMPEGAFDVVAFLPTFDPATHGAVRITANASVRLREIVFSGAPAADVVASGSVQLAAGGDPSIATARFVREDDPTVERTGMAGSDGRFSLTLPPGSYRASFTAPGHREVRILGVAATRAGAVGLVPIHLSPEAPGDFDDDGILDEVDGDADNDGCANADDLAPRDSYACRDADGDGQDDDIDQDDDDDGLLDAEEITAGLDTWITNPLAADTDGDGPDDRADNCPTFTNADQADANGDGRGDACATATSTTPGTPPTGITVFPSLVMPGDRIRFTGPGLVDVTSIHVGDIALDAVTATTGGVLATVPAGISPGETRLTTGRGEIPGPALSTITVRPVPGWTCPNGERLTFSRRGITGPAGEEVARISCESVQRTYSLSTGQLLMERSLAALPANTILYGVYDDLVLAVDPTTRELIYVNCGARLGQVSVPLRPGPALPLATLRASYSSGSPTILRSPTDGTWIDTAFCATLRMPNDLGGVAAIGSRATMSRTAPNFLVKHTTLGFGNLNLLADLVAELPQFDDGQPGAPEALLVGEDGMAWGLGGDVGVTLYRPFTAIAPSRVPGFSPLPGARFLADPTLRWLLVTETRPEPGMPLSTRTTNRTTILDLTERRVARRAGSELGGDFLPHQQGDLRSQLGGTTESGGVAIDIASAGDRPDSGQPVPVVCGDGQRHPSEECEPSVELYAYCSAGACVDCRCTMAACGNDIIESPVEDCERRTDCGSADTVACRQCLCRTLSSPVQFPDASGDAQTLMGVDLLSVELRIRTAQGDSLRMLNSFITGPGDAADTSVCFVVAVGPGQEQRLCISRDAAGTQSVTFDETGNAQRVLTSNQVSIGGPIGGMTELIVDPSVGLRVEPGLSFYVEALNGGQRTDVVPDNGTIAFTEIFGR